MNRYNALNILVIKKNTSVKRKVFSRLSAKRLITEFDCALIALIVRYISSIFYLKNKNLY